VNLAKNHGHSNLGYNFLNIPSSVTNVNLYQSIPNVVIKGEIFWHMLYHSTSGCSLHCGHCTRYIVETGTVS